MLNRIKLLNLVRFNFVNEERKKLVLYLLSVDYRKMVNKNLFSAQSSFYFDNKPHIYAWMLRKAILPMNILSKYVSSVDVS